MDIRKYIDLHFTEMIGVLDQIIRIPSVKGVAEDGAPFGKAPLKALEKVLQIASGMGFTVRNCDNRVGEIDFYKDKEAKLGILCHADVVPAGNNWKHEPYRATVDGDSIYGRGAIDDKGPIVAVLYAMKYLLDENVALHNNVRMIVGTDEECGSEDLSYYKQHAKLPSAVFTPDASYPVINTEKGRAVGTFTALLSGTNVISAESGAAVNAVPDKAFAVVKGVDYSKLSAIGAKCPIGITYDFTAIKDNCIQICASGKSAHASLPEGGENAITGLIAFLSYLEPGSVWDKAVSLFPHKETDGRSLGIACKDKISGPLTISLDILSLQNNRLSGTFDIRYPVCCTGQIIEDTLSRVFETHGMTLCGFSASAPHHTNADSPFVRTLLDVYEETTGFKGEAIAIGGGTYAHGIPGGVGFGPEFPNMDYHMHAEDEFIKIEHLKLTTEMICKAIQKLDVILS